MKKFFLTILILIIVLLAIAPFAFGLLFKHNFYNLVNNLNTDTSANIRIASYRLGWLRSYAKLMIEPRRTPNNHAFPSAQITVDEEISHGPFIYDPATHEFHFALGMIKSQVHFQPVESLLAIPADNGMMQVTTLTDFANHYFINFNAPAFVKEFPDHAKVDWKGMKGTSELWVSKDHIERIKSEALSGGVTLTAPSNAGAYTAKMNSYMMKSDSTLSAVTGLWQGEYTNSFGGISASMADTVFFSIDSINLTVKTNVEQNTLYNFDLNLNLSKFTAPEKIEIKPASLNVSVTNLNAPPLLRVLSMSMQEKRENLDIYPSLITPHTKIKGDLSVNTTEGRLFATGELSWPTLPVKVEEVPLKALLNAEMRISKSLLDYVITLVDGNNAPTAPVPNPSQPAASQPAAASTMQDHVRDLINRGYLVLDKDDYVSTILGKDGKITINGKDFPPAPSPEATSPSTDSMTPSQPSAAPSLPLQPIPAPTEKPAMPQ